MTESFVQPDPDGAPEPRFSAFISYSHRDREWSNWLHRALERYQIPRMLRGRPSHVGPLGKRLPPVFQDREELAASADLAESIELALRRSMNLIVLCSPDAARSRWVNEEVARFMAWGRRAQIYCLIIPPSAEFTASGADPLNIFPPALVENGAEPLAADARDQGDGKQNALIKLIAGMTGLNYDDLRQREQVRRQRRLVAITSASTTLSVAMMGLAGFALLARQEAARERDVAAQKALTAERTTDFVKSLFEVNDPSEAKGAKVTALEVLDKGTRQIDHSLSTEPNVRADLSTTLSEVYLNLGFFRRADALVRHSMQWQVNDPGVKARQFQVLGDAQARNGDYPAAIRSFDAAIHWTRQADAKGLLSRALIGRGEALSAVNQFGKAQADIATAFRLDVQQNGGRSLDAARDLEAAGLNADFADEYDRARGYYLRALAIRIPLQGVTHPRVTEDYNELGSLAYYQKNSADAERYWLRALHSDEVVLGPNHPDVAATLNNIGRVMIERRAFAEAQPLLQRAVAINLAQRDQTHDDLAFIFANLAIAERGLGHLATAQDLFERALRAANAHQSRNRAPIMTDLAELLCTEGHFDEAQRLLDASEPLMRSTYPDDPWRVAWTQNTRGYCLLRAGDAVKAAPLLRQSGAVLAARWGPASLYGATARSRLAALDRRRS